MNSIVNFDVKSDPTRRDHVVDRKVARQTRQAGKDLDWDKRYCCASCAYPVVEAASKIEFKGSSVHTRTNPEGRQFCFTCFESAPGCKLLGLPTYEHSWFQGYQWQYAHCVSCSAQLGWYFRGDYKIFALIQRSLVECEK